MNAIEFIRAYGPDIEAIYRASGTWKKTYPHASGYVERIGFYKGGEIWLMFDNIKNTVRAALYGMDKKFIKELAI